MDHRSYFNDSRLQLDVVVVVLPYNELSIWIFYTKKSRTFSPFLWCVTHFYCTFEIFFLSIHLSFHICIYLKRSYLAVSVALFFMFFNNFLLLLLYCFCPSCCCVVVYLFFMAHNDGGIVDDGASFDWFKLSVFNELWFLLPPKDRDRGWKQRLKPELGAWDLELGTGRLSRQRSAAGGAEVLLYICTTFIS